jgi:ubiquinone/menaquinone biosynthesis C-methylase UbiE
VKFSFAAANMKDVSMFNNLINSNDIYYIFKTLYHNPIEISEIITNKLFLNRNSKIRNAWAHTHSHPVNWWDIPAIERRWNYLITGDSEISYQEYICQKYLKNDLRALSIGCGTGQREIQWAKLGVFDKIDAYDISIPRIQTAIDNARAQHVDIINFCACDIYNIDILEEYYDVVLAEGSLHHFSPLDKILKTIRRSLKFDGYLIVNDFVIPTRFQWNDRQLEVANSLLHIFPDKYRKLYNNTINKDKIYRPSRLRMILNDPSEAIESSSITPSLYSRFNVIEAKNYGGTLLHLLFNGIAHHFLNDDKEITQWLKLCFDIEDYLMAMENIKSDYAIFICKKKQEVLS